MTQPPPPGVDSAGLITSWLEHQKAIFAAFAPQAGAASGDTLWRSYMEFLSAMAKAVPPQAGAIDSAIETLIQPGSGARGTGPQDLIGRLAGPGFATLWDWDRKSMKAYGAWLELQSAIAAHQAVLDSGWAEASKRFFAEIAAPADDKHKPLETWRAGLELWLATANRSLMETQRSEAFLDAQRRLLRATLEYRLQLREMAEELCELFQLPSREEIDELSRLVHDLRRELRALQRQRTEPA